MQNGAGHLGSTLGEYAHSRSVLLSTLLFLQYNSSPGQEIRFTYRIQVIADSMGAKQDL